MYVHMALELILGGLPGWLSCIVFVRIVSISQCTLFFSSKALGVKDAEVELEKDAGIIHGRIYKLELPAFVCFIGSQTIDNQSLPSSSKMIPCSLMTHAMYYPFPDRYLARRHLCIDRTDIHGSSTRFPIATQDYK